MRQIVWRERKRFAQLSVENLECGGQLALGTGARGKFFQIWKMWNRIAERDPDRRAPPRETAFLCVEAIVAAHQCWDVWRPGNVGLAPIFPSALCAVRERASAVPG